MKDLKFKEMRGDTGVLLCVFQFSLLDTTTIIGKTADWQLSRWKSTTTSTKRLGHRRSVLKRLAVCSVMYWSVIIEGCLEGKSVIVTEMIAAQRELSGQVNWRAWALQGVDWGCCQCIKRYHAQTSAGKDIQCCIPNIRPWLNQWHQQQHLTLVRRERTGLLPRGPKVSDESKF